MFRFLIFLFVCFLCTGPAFAQFEVPAEQVDNPVTGIVGLVLTTVALVGAFIARWSETNPDKPWYVRLSRVFDATQIVDSTRKLGD